MIIEKFVKENADGLVSHYEVVSNGEPISERRSVLDCLASLIASSKEKCTIIFRQERCSTDEFLSWEDDGESYEIIVSVPSKELRDRITEAITDFYSANKINHTEQKRVSDFAEYIRNVAENSFYCSVFTNEIETLSFRYCMDFDDVGGELFFDFYIDDEDTLYFRRLFGLTTTYYLKPNIFDDDKKSEVLSLKLPFHT